MTKRQDRDAIYVKRCPPHIFGSTSLGSRAPNVGDLERHIEFSRRCLALVPPSLLAPDHDVVPCLHGSCIID
jgi:hypothetical protein